MLKTLAIREPFEITALLHHRFERVQLTIVNEDLEIARFGEIDLCRQECCRAERVFTSPCKIGECCGQQRTADTIAEHIALPLAGFALHCGCRRKDALLHIVLERLAGEALVWIDPTTRRIP